jgi:hypothetical protein
MVIYTLVVLEPPLILQLPEIVTEAAAKKQESNRHPREYLSIKSAYFPIELRFDHSNANRVSIPVHLLDRFDL